MKYRLGASTASECARLVEQIRGLVRQKPRPYDWDEQVGELCDQLVMKLEPIDVIRPKE